MQGRGEGRQIPWATLHVAYDTVELTPPKSTATATTVTMQKGNVVTIKARGEQEFEILWIQA